MKPFYSQRWVNPLVPVCALFIFGGLFLSTLEQTEKGLQADISEQKESVVEGEYCFEPSELAVGDCETSVGMQGKQILACGEQNRWEVWGECQGQ